MCLQVRAHGANDSAYASYAAKLHVFYLLQCRQAAAYSLYAATTTFLPSLVVAVVLYYGGTLVLDNAVSSSSTLVLDNVKQQQQLLVLQQQWPKVHARVADVQAEQIANVSPWMSIHPPL